MNSGSGTYAILLRSRSSEAIEVGRWGSLRVKPGYYVYVGSAFGPGGVRARVDRHVRDSKRNHWHIDYLRSVVEPVGVWFSHAPYRLEHEWSQAFSQMEGVSCVSGFGCSDCMCESHLFFMPAAPSRSGVVAILGGSSDSCKYRSAA